MKTMNKEYTLIALIFWMIISLALACSIVGLLLFVRSDSDTKFWQGEKGRSAWCKIGIGLYDNLVKP